MGELAAVIDRQIPATSQHLRRLRELGVVIGERRRRIVAYRLRSGATAQQVRAMLATLTLAPPSGS